MQGREVQTRQPLRHFSQQLHAPRREAHKGGDDDAAYDHEQPYGSVFQEYFA